MIEDTWPILALPAALEQQLDGDEGMKLHCNTGMEWKSQKDVFLILSGVQKVNISKYNNTIQSPKDFMKQSGLGRWTWWLGPTLMVERKMIKHPRCSKAGPCLENYTCLLPQKMGLANPSSSLDQQKSDIWYPHTPLNQQKSYYVTPHPPSSTFIICEQFLISYCW